MSEFDRRRADLDASFKRTERLVSVWFVFVAVVAVAVLGVGVWAVVRLVNHFT